MKTYLARDERETSIDHEGDRLAYLVISFGLLAVVAYNAFAEGKASWELLGLVILGGLVGTAYRLLRGVMTRQAGVVVGLTLGIAAAVAVFVRLMLPA
jgi:hypothetical protein